VSWRLGEPPRSKPRECFSIAESDGAIIYDGPVGTDGNGRTYPVDERGGAYFEILLRHAAGTAYEVVDHPWRQRHLQADLEVPLHWPDGSPYRTEVLRFALDVVGRDVDWNAYYEGEGRLPDGRKVTVRLPMRVWENKDRVRWAHHPIVVDMAAISPAAPATDLVPAATASSTESAPALPLYRRVQFYDADGQPSGSATVNTERRGDKILRHMLVGAESIEVDDLDGNPHRVDVPGQRRRTAHAKREDDGSLTVTYDEPAEDTTATDALTDAASAIGSAAKALSAAAGTGAARQPRKAHATRNDDGSLVVTYDYGTGNEGG
jgi:hypothetical protein